jgi:hypothetical protein
LPNRLFEELNGVK